jgi:diaminohydroxyphosphoribosylaminopyrimidine deaminase/5-amino-6-(5-phosphoribosylamino)uracil reductase
MAMDEVYMRRCFDLAKLAGRKVRKNPQVGSVIVCNGKIISEAYHEAYGQNHAERNAILNLDHKDRHLLKHSSIYVSLEPCNIHGKTPPCLDLILKYEIPRVVVSVEDPNPRVSGRSLDLLRRRGVEVISGVLQEEGRILINEFRAQLQKRPFIMLKYAQSRDNYIGKKGQSIWLSNQAVGIKTHIWRSNIDAILVGYNTAYLDNPSLTTRLVPGRSPLRVVIDRDLSLPRSHKLWQDEFRTLFICDTTTVDTATTALKQVIQLPFDEGLASNLCKLLYEMNIYRMMVEGGAKTLSSFIKAGLWDEARVIKTEKILGSGIAVPLIRKPAFKVERFLNNQVCYYYND